MIHMATAMEKIVKSNMQEQRFGNHSFYTDSEGNKRCIYYNTEICRIMNDGTFWTDRSYGTTSTSKACTLYERALENAGYTQVEKTEKNSR